MSMTMMDYPGSMCEIVIIDGDKLEIDYTANDKKALFFWHVTDECDCVYQQRLQQQLVNERHATSELIHMLAARIPKDQAIYSSIVLQEVVCIFHLNN
jgi:hypothetical protein